MPRKGQCAACLSVRLPEAEELHRGGASARSIAAATGISRNTFLRHVETCMAGGGAKARVASPTATPAAPAPSGVPLVDALPIGPPGHPYAATLADRAEVYAAILTEFRSIVAGPAAARDKAALAPGLLRAIKDQEASISRVPALAAPAERLAQNEEWLAFRARLLAWLDRHPDVRLAFVEEFEQFLSESS